MGELSDVGNFFTFDHIDDDSLIRSAAFSEARRLILANGSISSKNLAEGFQFQGRRVPFVNPQRGIYKPQQMRHLLSVRTVYPRPGRKVWYADQRNVHQQIYNGDETVDYDFMGDNPDAPENRWLQEAVDKGIPIIYFLGTSPGIYQAIIPTFIVEFDRLGLKARMAFSTSATKIRPPETQNERRYALRSVKQRLHQSTFREMVIDAYRGRCAITGLPEPRLLDAAHIMEDANEQFGQPVVRNGLPLSKIHHAAFDANLIGIDADARVHVSEKLLGMRDGPQLEALQQFHGRNLLAPRREADSPDRDRLALRFEKFKNAA